MAVFEKTEREFPDAGSLLRDDLKALMRPWDVLNPDWLRANALVRLRRFSEARDTLQEWIRREPWDPYEKAVAKLSREIVRLEKQPWEDWITA